MGKSLLFQALLHKDMCIYFLPVNTGTHVVDIITFRSASVGREFGIDVKFTGSQRQRKNVYILIVSVIERSCGVNEITYGGPKHTTASQ